MNILITNDDGIHAQGLIELMQALNDEGFSIYVCAPDGQRSATGHGITMHETIYVNEVILEGAEIAYQTSGLPADCVKLGVELIERKGIKIDMVFSGINHGGNLGTDTHYSGTVAGALEGAICGFPSVSVSVDSHEAEYFDYACELAVKAARSLEKQIEEGTVDVDTVLNINTPNLPKNLIKGLRYTRLGVREYDEEFTPTEKGENVNVPGPFRYYGVPVHYVGLPEDIDVIANQEKYATITPIHTDMTKYEMIEKIKDWGLE